MSESLGGLGGIGDWFGNLFSGWNSSATNAAGLGNGAPNVGEYGPPMSAMQKPTDWGRLITQGTQGIAGALGGGGQRAGLPGAGGGQMPAPGGGMGGGSAPHPGNSAAFAQMLQQIMQQRAALAQRRPGAGGGGILGG